MCAYFNDVATLAQLLFERFPAGMDWDAHVAAGGDCWDVEIMPLVEKYLEQGVLGFIKEGSE